MKNRKLPFGYEMRMGKICLKEREAELVNLIFQRYSEGISYNQIVSILSNQPIPYRETDQPWNKNMVARILQDERYTGTTGFPPVVDPDLFQEVQRKRPLTGGSSRNVKEMRQLRELVTCTCCGSQMVKNQRDNWNCPVCGGPSVKLRDQTLLEGVQSLLLPLAQESGRVVEPSWHPRDHRDLEAQLEQLLSQPGQDEARAKELALALAEAQLADIDSKRYETLRIRSLLKKQGEQLIKADLIRMIVKTIYLHPDRSLSLKLKNGQTIERGNLS